MAKKDATDHKQRGKSATAKSPKPPKKKGGKERQPLNREERQRAAWFRKTEHKVAQQVITEVGAKASAGLTFDQLKASGLMAKPSQTNKSTDISSAKAFALIFEQALLEALQKILPEVVEQARQFESTNKSVSLPALPEPEIHFGFGAEIFGGETFNNITVEDIVEPFGDAATRDVVVAEIRCLLEKTGLIFNAYREPSILATPSVAVGDAFEKEPGDSPLRLRLAEVILADDPMAAIENLLEETWGQMVELQHIAGSLEPESELEKSARLELIDEATADRLKKAAVKEAIRLDLSQRLAGLTASTGAPAEVDEAFATLIAEAAQAAEAQRRERAVFRKTLQGLRQQRKEREGRRFSSKSSEKFGDDEEFIRFLASHREEPGAKQALLALKVEAEIAAAEKDWADLKSRLAAGANDPETAVAQNATAMKNILGDLAQIRALHVQLEELDRPG